jgi:succinate dehydrogenase/fumarate reductase flavoprotein subunit
MNRSLQDIQLKTDVLVIGGGIAGCMAAIRASELGADVLIVEKANTRRSGCAATGIDHCWSYIPHIHGEACSVEDIVEDHAKNAGGFIFKELVHRIADNSYERILDLERFGVPMRDENGVFRLVKKIHRVPSFIHFAGRDLKAILTKTVRSRGIKILNRAMITDLIVKEGEIAGCVGISTRSQELFAIRAKSVVLTTGSVFRLYGNPTGMPFNLSHPPSETGDGRAMALRAGAALINMEFITMQTGPKFFERCGRGTYVPGVLRDGSGKRLGTPAEHPANGSDSGSKRIDSSVAVNARAVGALHAAVESPEGFMKTIQEGRGPIYMDCTANSREQIQYIEWALRNEGNTVFLDHLSQEGFGLDKQMIEFSVYEPKLSNGNSGLYINSSCETSLPGLYAAGDAIGGVKRAVCPGALTLGWFAGEQAAGAARRAVCADFDFTGEKEVKHRKEMVSMISNGQGDATWQEAQLALQNIMDDYGGLVRSETMLKTGLSHLSWLKKEMLSDINAANPHERYRTLEVFNLITIGEAVMTAALTRTESRLKPGYHFRADYPSPDDTNWRKFLTVRRENGHLVTDTVPL